MVAVAYDCPNCGVVETCDVDDSGERVCPGCEAPVNGITPHEAEQRRDMEYRGR